MASSRNRNRNRIISSPFLLLLCLFYIFTSALAASTVLGLDLGTEYIKATLVKAGMQNVLVETKDTRRKEAATIAFKPVQAPKLGEYPERAYGSDAVALAARFPGDVYSNLKTLLGLTADNSVVKDYASMHPALKLSTDKIRGTAAFQSAAFVDGEEPWTVEELLAMQFQSIQKNAEALAGKGSIVKDLVITVPPFYTAEEKRAVILAADLAGLRVLELISDGLAVGLNYAMSRKFASISDEGVKPEYHMVFDMGAGSTKASVIKFQGRTVKDVGKYNKTIQEVQVLGSGWDRTLGGDALNAVIVNDMVTKFVESSAAKKISATVEGVKAHGRAMSKLWKEAERLRQVLSANTNTQGSFEGLYEDVDFRYKISRAEFEKLSTSHAARIGVAVQKALEAAELSVNDLDSVILHGGAIRTPFILKELETIVGNAEKLRSNVNADEAAVFGAGFRGATLSPSFRVKEIRASEGASYAAGIKWINIYEKPQHQRLWQPTSFIGAEKQYTFKNQKDFDINFYQHVPSSENVSPGSAEKELITVTTQNLTESVAILKDKFGCTDGDINLKLSTRIGTSDGEINIMKLILDCEVEDVEKPGMVDSMKNMFGFGKKDQAPLEEIEPLDGTTSGSSTTETSSSSTSTSTSTKTKSAKDSKKSKETTKPTKHFEVIPVEYTIVRKGLPQLPAEELSRMKDRIAAFAGSDRTRRLREEALNQLEGFTYRVRDLLDNSEFVVASTPEERANLEAKGKEASEWMYSPEGRDATRDELKAKLKTMEDIVGPIQTRKEEAAALPEMLKALEVALNETKYTIIGITEQITNDTKIHESWSSSRSAASTATPSPSTVDDFADLEDDSSETSAALEEEAPEPPTYTTADLVRPQELFDSFTAWLEENLPKQQALKPTDDPIILVKDISVKVDQLNQVKIDLIMKSMKRPYKSTRPPTKSKNTKKSSKTTTSTSSKTTSGEKADATFNLEDLMKDGAKRYEPNSGLPSEDDIFAFIEKQKIVNQMAEEEMAKHEPVTKQVDEEDVVDVDAGDDEDAEVVGEGHDEL
jgi:hypoxia up-regulated 1